MDSVVYLPLSLGKKFLGPNGACAVGERGQGKEFFPAAHADPNCSGRCGRPESQTFCGILVKTAGKDGRCIRFDFDSRCNLCFLDHYPNCYAYSPFLSL